MNMKKLWYVVIVLAVIYFGWEFFRPRPATMQSQTRIVDTSGTASIVDSLGNDANNSAAPAVVEPAVANGPVSVTYSANGFSPKEVTVKKGEAVMWTNASNGGMQVASDNHPAHTGYNGTSRREHCAAGAASSFDECVSATAGAQWSFVFNKAGVWKYHNHANKIFGGTVTVTE